jgi:hypothetical protein
MMNFFMFFPSWPPLRLRSGFYALLLLTMVPGGIAQTPSTIPDIYTCTDARGRKLTSDRPIMECRDREQTLLNPSGTVKAKVGPVLTERELSLLEAQKKLEQAEQVRLQEEKKRDRALLARYPNLEVHQKERAEALANIDRIKQIATARMLERLQERSKLTDELAFYQKDPSKIPFKLRRQMDEVKQSLAVQERFLSEQDAEAKRINQRFDMEFQRLIPLWRMASITVQ